MAGTTGLEPAASAVTGQRSNQLNYVPTRQIDEMRVCMQLCALAPAAIPAPVWEARRKTSHKHPNSFASDGKARLWHFGLASLASPSLPHRRVPTVCKLPGRWGRQNGDLNWVTHRWQKFRRFRAMERGVEDRHVHEFCARLDTT